MITAEYQDREASAFAVVRGAQTPPGARRVNDADVLLVREPALDDSLDGERLAAPGFPENGQVLLQGGFRNLH